MDTLIQFIEWESFADRRDDLLSSSENDEMQATLRENPRFGPVIRGTGGCRKMRIKAKGSGKRSGARVIYYYHDAGGRIHLLMLFAKNEKTDLTQKEARQLRAVIAPIKIKKE